MIFWLIAIAVTAIACAALFYAARGRTVNAAGPVSSDDKGHFRQLLAGIEADLASGKLDEDQALAAKGELAREMLRGSNEARRAVIHEFGRGQLLVGLAAIAALSFGIYALLGSPDLPTRPLAGRPEIAAQSINLDDAVARIESRLAETPDDLRGWTVIGPAYLELGRFEDAANAYRRVIDLAGPSAEAQTDLAEALLLSAGGQGSDEAVTLLREAAAGDATHIRSRLYLAAELMRMARYDEAAEGWRQVIGLADGDEPWLPAARQGLVVAENDGVDVAAEEQASMIGAMVSGLSERLFADGGSVEEWTQLVRSYLVLGDSENAQLAYDAAVAAYPAAFDRGELDTLALSAGLKLNGDTP